MNLLSSKTRIRRVFFVFAGITFCFNVLNNDCLPGNDFSEEIKNSDAYLMHSYTDVIFKSSVYSYKKEVSIQRKIVINNKSGVDEYAFISFSKYILDHLKKLQVVTLKSDGTVIKLDSSLIVNLKSEKDRSDIINYPIPGVEPGDTIEINYAYYRYLKLYQLGEFISLFNELPSLSTEFTISAPPDHIIRYKQYNGFPDPQVLVTDTVLYCAFKLEEIKGCEENSYTCVPCELPYIYFSINTKEEKIRSWKDVYNQEFNINTQPLSLDIENRSFYRRWKKRIINDEKDSSKYYQFNLLYKDILDNYTIESVKKDEIKKSSGYFLNRHRFDPYSILRLYRQVLEDLDIKYWAVFARSKRAGEIDPDYIRKGDFDHIFFAYENGAGSLSFLYPHNIGFKYQIGEIPTSLYNTTAVIVQPFINDKVKVEDKYIGPDYQLAETDSVKVNIIKLPGMNTNLNYLHQFVTCDIDPREKKAGFNSKITISGGLSTDLRSFLSVLDQNREFNDFYNTLSEFENETNALEIDSITDFSFDNTIPFSLNIKATGRVKNSVTFLNDSMVSITLDKLIQHNRVESEKEVIDMNYYLNYCYSDISTYILSFSDDIEVLSFENYNKSLSNPTCEYFFQLNLNSNKIIVQSNFRIKKDRIEKDEYIQLREVNDLIQEARNIRLLVKVL